jgi:DNA-directed RNA polymerase subunit RPC12/RpoP
MSVKPTTSRRCHHCSREVAETQHTRTSYRVASYELHGGEVEAVVKRRSADDPEEVTILRLVRPREVYTCADCYRLPEVAALREVLFRPEIAH